MPDRSKEILELIDKLPELLKGTQQSSVVDDKAQDIAHAALDQMESLIPASREAYRSGNDPLHDLKQIATQDGDAILGGKAMVHALDHLKEMSECAKSSWQYRIRSLFNAKLRHQSKDKDEMLNMLLSFLVARRIKQDLMDKYEWMEPKK